MSPDLVTSPSLGRRLFDEEPSLTILPTLLMVLGSLCLLGGVMRFGQEGWGADGAVIATLGAALAGLGVHFQYVRVTIHENGVLRRTLLGRRELLFADVAGIRQWNSKVRLLPAGGGKPFPLRQSHETENLRDWIAMRLEEQLLQQLEQQGEVRWSTNVWLSRSGVRWQSEEEGDILTPLSSSLRITVDGSYCRIYHPHRPLVPVVPVSEALFFPGLLLLQRLMADAPPAAQYPEPAEPAEPDGEPGLGRPVATLRGWRLAPLAAFLVGLVMTGNAVLSWIRQGHPPEGLVWWFLLAWHGLAAGLHDRIDGYDHGLAITRPWGRRREMPFSGIRDLRYARRFEWFGESVTFELRDPSGGTVSGRALTRNHDLVPGLLRDRIAETLAEDLDIRMRFVGEVPWGEGARLSREWIHGRDASGTERSCPVSRGLRFTSDGHRLRLYRSGSSEPFLYLELEQWGAYPGLLLLQRLVEKAEA
ncbi:MAG: hypothetical protein ABUT39_16950 [Acidobacteriota bacterium]